MLIVQKKLTFNNGVVTSEFTKEAQFQFIMIKNNRTLSAITNAPCIDSWYESGITIITELK